MMTRFLLATVWTLSSFRYSDQFVIGNRVDGLRSTNVVISHQHPSTTTSLTAKKSKKRKKKGPQKQSGFEWASSFVLQPYEAKDTCEIAENAVAAFKRCTGTALSPELEGAANTPKALWRAPIACMIVKQSEDGSTAAVEYANVAALETVGLQPNEFDKLFQTGPVPKLQTNLVVDLPSEMKGGKNFEKGYRKKIFEDVTILEASRWSLQKSSLVDGKFVTEDFGVAYAWPEWVKGDDTLCRPGGINKKVEDLGDLDDRIQKQGEFIRELKEGKGLTNSDPEVAEAVKELLRLKSLKE